MYNNTQSFKYFLSGCLAMLPVALAVIPWGFLVGAYSLEVGLSAVEAQAMSLFVFSGMAQLVALGLIQSEAGIFSIALTVALITSRHLLYSLALRGKISPLPAKWRVAFGFLLTDQLFVSVPLGPDETLNKPYLLGAGLTMYIVLNLATLAGIVAGESVPNLDELGLEFAIVATFIAMLIPMIKSAATGICVVVSVLMSVVSAYFGIQAGLLLSIVGGMLAGFLYAQAREYLQ
jgi:predicted branched-subunit amino acid permease